VIRRLRRALGDLELSADERQALKSVARWVAREHVEARRSPTIDATAWISPLASIRFAERVEIGPRATIGPHCCVWGGWTTTWARVGADALLSPGVVLVAGNHTTDGPGPVRDLGFEELDVEIGAGAWVGAHAVVVGARVGEGAVVAANSVVLEDVEPYAIVAGAPARVVGRRTGIDS
jgi:acetyltransferase-like isoleucine patch superfamily enzyme